MQFDRGTRILRVISRAGRPCHLSKPHQYHWFSVCEHNDCEGHSSLRYYERAS